VDYKTILVYCDEQPSPSQPLRLAFRLAERFDAHLTAMLAVRSYYVSMYAMDASSVAVWAAEAEKRRREIDHDAKRAFQAEAARFPAARAEFTIADTDELMDPGRTARVADLVLIAQPRAGDTTQTLFVGDLLLSSGRPVLFVPYAGRFADVGRRVLIAWNGSREAARAVADALPLLRSAESVDVVTFDPSASLLKADTDVARYLSRHGVRVTMRREPLESMEVGNLLLSRASDLGSDLIVMGGYGHSRLRERVLGGATRALLDEMAIPILISH